VSRFDDPSWTRGTTVVAGREMVTHASASEAVVIIDDGVNQAIVGAAATGTSSEADTLAAAIEIVQVITR